jgi:hypothetical protein
MLRIVLIFFFISANVVATPKYDNLYEHYDIDAPHVLYVLHDVCVPCVPCVPCVSR